MELVDAVVALLNGGTYVLPVLARRLYQPVLDAAQLQDLHVSVIPKALEYERVNRAQLGEFDYAVDVGVQQRIDVDDSVAMDTRMLLVQQLADRLRANPQIEAPRALLLTLENDPVFHPEHLQKFRQFTSVLTVRYRLWRSA